MAAQPENPVSQLPPRGEDDDFGEEMASVGTDEGQPGQDGPAGGHPPQTPPPAANTTQQPARARVPTTRKQAKYSRRNIALANSQSKNPLFRAIHPLHLAVLAFMFIAMGVLSGAIATNNWFVVSTSASLDRVGIFKQCQDKPEKLACVDRTFGFSSSQCDRSEDDVKFINTIVMILCFAAIAFSLFTFLCAALARAVSQPCMSVSAILFSFLAFGTASSTLGVFMWHKERWEFCDKSFCDFYKAEASTTDDSCEASYGFSAGLAAIGMGACLVAFVFAVLRFVFREWNIKDDESQTNVASDDLSPKHKPRATAVAPDSHEPFEAECSEAGNDAQVALDLPPPPEGGDWVFDAESGMYWSEQEFLFMDPYTQHSYDPNSDMWYDPDAEEWYEGEQVDDGAEA